MVNIQRTNVTTLLAAIIKKEGPSKERTLDGPTC